MVRCMKAYLVIVSLIAACDALQYYTRSKCSRQCPCYYQSLFCKGYQMTSLPDDLSADVQNIDFQSNSMKEVKNDTFARFSDLKKLLLGGNKIKFIDIWAFNKNTRINALDLSDNLLSEMNSRVFDPIRKKCEHLSLLGNNISQIEGMFQNMRVLKTLNLKSNRISVITAETFHHNKRMRFLQLSNNDIEYISPEAFVGQTELQYLYLDNNKLWNLTELNITSKKLEMLSISNSGLQTVPKGLSKSIRQLNLAGNRLKAIDGESLQKLRSLESLDLSRNLISSLDSKALRHHVGLKVLYLSTNRLLEVPKKLPISIEKLTLDGNLISQLPRVAFPRLFSLKLLDLKHNKIEYVHKFALCNLTRLTSLDLSNNIIGRLNSDMFADLINLKTLDLSKNPVTVIEDGVFDNLVTLDSLSLNNLNLAIKVRGGLLGDSTKLRILNIYNSESIAKAVLKQDLTMYHLRSVEYLNLMNNNLRELIQTFPQYLPNLKRIQLSANPWHCTRHLYWLSRWLQGGIIEEPHLLHIICSSPEALKGRQMVDLDPFDWVS